MSRRKQWIDDKTKLDRLFALYPDIPENPRELREHWTRYLAIRVSGLLEVAVSDILTRYSETRSSERIVRYMGKKLDRPNNINMDKILSITADFGADWSNEIANHDSHEKLKNALESVNHIRNAAAHGENLTVSYSNLAQYYESYIVMIELWEEMCVREDSIPKFTRKDRRRL